MKSAVGSRADRAAAAPLPLLLLPLLALLTVTLLPFAGGEGGACGVAKMLRWNASGGAAAGVSPNARKYACHAGST